MGRPDSGLQGQRSKHHRMVRNPRRKTQSTKILAQERKNQAQAETTWLPLNLSETNFQTSLLVKVGQAIIEVRPGFEPKLLLDVVKTLIAQ